MDGFSVEKTDLSKFAQAVYVTALVYVPDDHSKKLPAVAGGRRGTLPMENSTINR